MAKLVALVAASPISASISRRTFVEDLSGELVDGGVKASNLVILLLRRGLRSPETLALEALVLGLESADSSIPSHGVRVVVHLVMDANGLEFKGKNVTLQESGCSKDNEISWGGSGAWDAATEFNDAAPKNLNVLAGFLEEREALEFVNQSANCSGAHLLELVDDSGKGFRSRGVDAKVLFDSFPEGKGHTV
jgi:hypothetical protein